VVVWTNGTDFDIASDCEAMRGKVGIYVGILLQQTGVLTSVEYSRACDGMFLRREEPFWPAQFVMTRVRLLYELAS